MLGEVLVGARDPAPVGAGPIRHAFSAAPDRTESQFPELADTSAFHLVTVLGMLLNVEDGFEPSLLWYSFKHAGHCELSNR